MEFSNRAEQVVYVIDRFVAFVQTEVPAYSKELDKFLAMPPLAKIAVATDVESVVGDDIKEKNLCSALAKFKLKMPGAAQEIGDEIEKMYSSKPGAMQEKFWHYLTVLKELLED